MDDDEVQEQLMLDMAKGILRNSLSWRDNIFRTISTISAVAVPTYLAVLTKWVSSTAGISLWIQLLPVFLWVMALLVLIR
jgi:hypothetical protein